MLPLHIDLIEFLEMFNLQTVTKAQTKCASFESIYRAAMHSQHIPRELFLTLSFVLLGLLGGGGGEIIHILKNDFFSLV